MKSRSSCRKDMHLAILQLLELPEYFAVWKDRSPRAFRVKVADFRHAVEALGLLISQQLEGMADPVEDKDPGQSELEVIACEIAQAFACWLESQGRDTDAFQIDMSLTHWQSLHDTELIAKARLLRRMLILALSTDGDSLIDYDLTADDAIALADGIVDFEAGVASAESDISEHRALTGLVRPRYREVSVILTGLDRLVLRFRRTEPGTRFAEAWQASRIVRDLGRGAAEIPAPPAA